LSEIAGGNQFRWAWLGAKGPSGGILMGIKEDLYEVEDTEIGEFYVSMVLRHRATNFRWKMLTVYGHAHPEGAANLMSELSKKCFYSTLPVVMGGDFNLIRSSNEKNNENLNLGLMERFNMFIEVHQLQELRRSGPRYTWKNPVIVTLDRILVSTEWEARFPLCFAWSKTRVGSDH
jgi:hypothetical protein